MHAKLALESLAPGDVLEVWVDHEPAVRNVPRSARAWGQRVDDIASLADGSGWSIRIVKQTREV